MTEVTETALLAALQEWQATEAALYRHIDEELEVSAEDKTALRQLLTPIFLTHRDFLIELYCSVRGSESNTETRS